MKLNEAEKKLISKEIEKLEKLSSAELVAVVTKRSGNYNYASSLINVFIVFLISFLLIFLFSKTSIELLQIQLLIFIGISLIFEKYRNIILKVLPKSYKYKKAKENAQMQFYNLGLNRTKTKQAIMFFVSFDEKYVEIISDSEIAKKIDDTYWQEIIDEFILDVKKNHLAKGYLKAIKSCTSVLIEKFPIKHDDENELSNDVIELKS